MLDDAGRHLLGDAHLPALFAVDLPGYTHDSGPLGEDVRLSLLEDLAPPARSA